MIRARRSGPLRCRASARPPGDAPRRRARRRGWPRTPGRRSTPRGGAGGRWRRRGSQGRVDLGEVAQRRRKGRHSTSGGVEPGTGRGEVPPAEPHQPAPEVERGDREGRDTAVPGSGPGEQVLRLADLPAGGLEHGQRTQVREVGPALRCALQQHGGLRVTPDRLEDARPLRVEGGPVRAARSGGVEVGECLGEPVEGASRSRPGQPGPCRCRARRGRAARPARRHVRSRPPDPARARAAEAGRSGGPVRGRPAERCLIVLGLLARGRRSGHAGWPRR